MPHPQDVYKRQPVDDDKNDDAQYPHGDADEETLQEQPEQRSYIHLHLLLTGKIFT